MPAWYSSSHEGMIVQMWFVAEIGEGPAARAAEPHAGSRRSAGSEPMAGGPSIAACVTPVVGEFGQKRVQREPGPVSSATPYSTRRAR